MLDLIVSVCRFCEYSHKESSEIEGKNNFLVRMKEPERNVVTDCIRNESIRTDMTSHLNTNSLQK